jgi:putative Mg2+ transporter-C (MgtC) family protein
VRSCSGLMNRCLEAACQSGSRREDETRRQTDLMSFDPLNPDTPEFWLRLGTAVVCGGVIGLERQLRGKAAGIRTSILICLGTELFVGLGASFSGERVDPTRVLGQVVTGIGFLGGGVILAREGSVIGVTSAAVIWVLAALGSLVGLGHLLAALVLTIVTVGLLTGVELLESVFRRLRDGATERELERIDIEE